MSVHVFFAFSSGLRKPLIVPAGTKQRLLDEITATERTLDLEREQYRENPVHWKRTSYDDVEDATLCDTVQRHNAMVRRFYADLQNWCDNPVENGETLTPDDAAEFWHGLKILHVPPQRWTGDYYRGRMEAIYEVMRGRDTEGVSFDEAALTPKQAGAVIRLFEQYLDPEDHRLEVPLGCDHLASSSDGEYEWCSRCGAVLYEYADNCNQPECPAREGWDINDG